MAIFACWRGVISWKRTRLRLGGRQARGSSTHISDLVPSGDHRSALLVAQVWSGAWEIEAKKRAPKPNSPRTCPTRVEVEQSNNNCRTNTTWHSRLPSSIPLDESRHTTIITFQRTLYKLTIKAALLGLDWLKVDPRRLSLPPATAIVSHGIS
jgi:hypothetical protein